MEEIQLFAKLAMEPIDLQSKVILGRPVRLTFDDHVVMFFC